MAFVRILAFNYDNLRGKHSKNLKEVAASVSCQSTQTTHLGCHGSLYNIIVLLIVFLFFFILVYNIHESALCPSQAFIIFFKVCASLNPPAVANCVQKGALLSCRTCVKMLTSWCIALLSGEWQSLSSFAHTDPYRYLSYDNVFLQDEHSFITC